MPVTIVPHAITTAPCHRPLPKWSKHHRHYTTVSSNKRSTSPSTFTLRVASTWATTSRRLPFSPVVFFEHTPSLFAAYGVPRRLSSSSMFPRNVKKSQAPPAVGVSPSFSLKLKKKATRRSQSHIANHGSFSWDVWFGVLGLCSSVRLFCASDLLALSFSCVHSMPTFQVSCAG
jgi:hypothetical protein